MLNKRPAVVLPQSKAERKIEVGDVFFLKNMPYTVKNSFIEFKVIHVGHSGRQVTLLDTDGKTLCVLNAVDLKVTCYISIKVVGECTSVSTNLMEDYKDLFGISLEGHIVTYDENTLRRPIKVGDMLTARKTGNAHIVQYVCADNAIVTTREKTGESVLVRPSELRDFFLNVDFI